MAFGKYLFLALTLVFVFIFARNFFTLFFAMENYNIHKKRMEQLKFKNKKNISDEEQTRSFIEKITRPAITYILPKINYRNDEELKRDLSIIGWDKYFTPIQFRGMNITFKILAVIVFVILSQVKLVVGVIWFLALFFLFGFLFNNAVKEKKSQLFSEFPEFIRITQGYLNAKVPFTQAIERSIEYLGDSWRPIMQEFIITCDTQSVEDALEELKEKIDIFEVRQLISLIKLNLEQGINIKESFDAQIKKVRDMQLEAISIKISKRQIMAVALQGPLLLTLIGGFGLPVLASMFQFTAM